MKNNLIMAKETFYFSHDFNARNDRKLIKLKLKHRMAGIGIYWSIVEMLFEENGFLPISEIKTIAKDLREKESVVFSVINDFDLFENDGEIFWSNSVKRRMGRRLEKSSKAKESAYKRWKNDANASQPECERNAIKESKVKESKEENKKEKFPNMPKMEDVGELPPVKIESAKEQIKITTGQDVSEKQILLYWTAWKKQKLTGEKYYAGLHEVYSHFINCAKKEKFTPQIRAPEKQSAPLRTADYYK